VGLVKRTVFLLIFVLCFLGAIFFFMTKSFRELDHSGMPSRARLAEEIAPVVGILGGEPAYADRQIRRDMSAEVSFDEVAFAGAKKIIESNGWRYVITERRGITTQYKYCHGRLAFTFEVVEEKSLSYGVTWESQPRAFAYCNADK
jgi:hypothetical protein